MNAVTKAQNTMMYRSTSNTNTTKMNNNRTSSFIGIIIRHHKKTFMLRILFIIFIIGWTYLILHMITSLYFNQHSNIYTESNPYSIDNNVKITNEISPMNNNNNRPSSQNNDENQVSIVSSCKGRFDAILQVLPTWLQASGVGEIILVDWDTTESSSQQRPLVEAIQQIVSHPINTVDEQQPLPQITLIVVHDEPKWILSRAFNVGFKYAKYPLILKLDCDYLASKDVIEKNILSPTSLWFYTGNWRTAKTPNEMHLNGALFVSRKSLTDIGGYDERIQTYGWDDSDMYDRLEKYFNKNKKNSPSLLSVPFRRDFISGTLFHLQHNDSSRIVIIQQQQQPSQHNFNEYRASVLSNQPECSTQINRILLTKIKTLWPVPGISPSTYKVLSPSSITTKSSYSGANNINIIHLQHNYVPPPLPLLVSPSMLSDTHREVVNWYLMSKCHLHPNVISNIGNSHGGNYKLFKLFEKFQSQQQQHRSSIVIVVIHFTLSENQDNIAIRLRILGSMMSSLIMLQMDNNVAVIIVFIVVWPVLKINDNLMVSFDDVFENQEQVMSINDHFLLTIVDNWNIPNIRQRKNSGSSSTTVVMDGFEIISDWGGNDFAKKIITTTQHQGLEMQNNNNNKIRHLYWSSSSLSTPLLDKNIIINKNFHKSFLELKISKTTIMDSICQQMLSDDDVMKWFGVRGCN
jgi:hypothetical protein